MPGDGPLDFLPLWGLLAANVLLVLLAVEAGFRTGRFRREHSTQEKEAPVGGMVAATLGLLAFLLAFTFSMAASRFEARRLVLLDEANAIGTTYLRTDFLPEPERGKSRRMLRDYVELRLQPSDPSALPEAIRRSEQLHNELWAEAVNGAGKSPNTVLASLYVQSLNETIDIHSKRLLTVTQTRIPAAIWLALYAVSILGLAAMGYQCGLSGSTRSLAIFAVVLTFSVVMWIIADLDRPMEGSLQVSQKAMTDLRASMIEAKP